MVDALFSAYGPQHWWPAQSPFEVVVGAYLTQNTAWTSVERSLDQIRCAGALSVDGLRSISLDNLQKLIRPSGFATRKAAAVKAFIALLDAEFDGSLDAMSAAPTETLRHMLLALAGVGPETADAILLYALGHRVPVADEYLRRIVERHGLLEADPDRKRITYDDLAQLTRSAFAQDPESDRSRLYNEFHALTVAVGKAHCSRSPDCVSCPLAYDAHSVPAENLRGTAPGRANAAHSRKHNLE
jgi:endonuclease-3 related protein